MIRSVSPTLFAVILLVSGCGNRQPPGGSSPSRPPLLEPIVPLGYNKIAPAAADDSAQMLAQTAVIFRGTLKEANFTYDDCGGPRTNYVFSDVSPLAGTPISAAATLSVLGGPTPTGTWVSVSGIPKLALGAEYVVFLRNTDWTLSPIVGDLIFRRETEGSRELLVDPTGRAVTGWNEDGPVLSAAVVSEPVGHKVRGYRGSEARAGAGAATGGTDPGTTVQPAAGNPPPPAPGPSGGSKLSRAPSPDEIVKAGLFSRPPLNAGAIGREQPATVESLLAAVRSAAARANVNIGGRIAFAPYWRCWSFTKTTRAGQ